MYENRIKDDPVFNNVVLFLQVTLQNFKTFPATPVAKFLCL